MKKLGILVSGKGSNMTAIINACEEGYLPAKVEVVISSNPKAGALEIAKEKKRLALAPDQQPFIEHEPLPSNIS